MEGHAQRAMAVGSTSLAEDEAAYPAYPWPMKPDLVLRIAEEVCSTLGEAHGKGIVQGIAAAQDVTDTLRMATNPTYP